MLDAYYDAGRGLNCCLAQVTKRKAGDRWPASRSQQQSQRSGRSTVPDVMGLAPYREAIAKLRQEPRASAAGTLSTLSEVFRGAR